MDKSLILKEIKKAYGFRYDADFARFLGVSPQTLGTWLKRGTFDMSILYSKCKGINPDYLITGEGPVMRDSGNVGENNTGNVATTGGVVTTNVDDRLLKMLEDSQQERLKLLAIIENLTSK